MNMISLTVLTFSQTLPLRNLSLRCIRWERLKYASRGEPKRWKTGKFKKINKKEQPIIELLYCITSFNNLNASFVHLSKYLNAYNNLHYSFLITN